MRAREPLTRLSEPPDRAQPALDRPERTGELAGSLFGRKALEKAQHQDVTQFGRKFAQLGVEDRPDVAASRPSRLAGAGMSAGTALRRPRRLTSRARALVATRVATPYNHGPSRSASRSLPGLADQHEERRLERVVSIVRVAEQAPADPQDHRPMPRDNRLKRRLVAVVNETLQKRPIS